MHKEAGSSKCPITVTYGDGIGPEIMTATLAVLEAAGAQLDIDVIEIGEKLYNRGITTGIDEQAWQSIRKNKVFLKAPITTPQGDGVKSLNVTIRKALGLFANVRPCSALSPHVATKHPKMDLVIIRENEEDTYAGIEHRQTAEVSQCLKLISRPGCEKISRYAFEYARRYGRKKVTCMVKDNIMKITDGMFHQAFKDVAAEYSDIQNESMIIDIGTARLADTPEDFDVIVTLNLYGDIISDVTAQLAGSVGLAGSSNVGTECAMFEAIHGSAPTIAGQDIANPSGLLNGAIMMLVHIGQPKVAEKIHNAWLKTLEEGIHTADISSDSYTKKKVGTTEFAKELIKRLGEKPVTFKPITYQENTTPWLLKTTPQATPEKTLVGVDVFIDSARAKTDVDWLGKSLQDVSSERLNLMVITNRGVSVFPSGFSETFHTDHWRCRFQAAQGVGLANRDIIELLQRIDETRLDVIKTENLYLFDGKPGFSLAQGASV